MKSLSHRNVVDLLQQALEFLVGGSEGDTVSAGILNEIFSRTVSNPSLVCLPMH